MRIMPYGDGALLVDAGEEGPLVVEAEVEDAVLVREAERGLVGCGIFA